MKLAKVLLCAIGLSNAALSETQAASAIDEEMELCALECLLPSNLLYEEGLSESQVDEAQVDDEEEFNASEDQYVSQADNEEQDFVLERRQPRSRQEAKARRIRIAKTHQQNADRRRQREKEALQKTSNSLDMLMLDDKIFRDANETEISDVCSICIAPQDGSSVVSQSCQHVFHAGCIRRCIEIRPSDLDSFNTDCPLCNQDLTSLDPSIKVKAVRGRGPPHFGRPVVDDNLPIVIHTEDEAMVVLGESLPAGSQRPRTTVDPTQKRESCIRSFLNSFFHRSGYAQVAIQDGDL